AFVRVKRVRAAEGDGLVAAGVTEGPAERDRDLERTEALGHHFFATRAVFAGRREVADDESLRAVEGSAQEQLRAEAVETVRRLVQILEQDDAALQARLQRCPAHRGERRQVAAGERPFGTSALRGS